MDYRDLLVKQLVRVGALQTEPDAARWQARPELPIRALARLGMLDEISALQKISQALKVPYYDLENPHVASLFTIEKFISKVNRELCWSHKVIPLCQKDGRMIVAFANPLDVDARQALQFLLNESIYPVLAEEVKIVQLLERHMPRPPPNDLHTLDLSNVSQGARMVEILTAAQLQSDNEKEKTDVNSLPIVRLCNKIMFDAIEGNASDIHIEPTLRGLEVRIRVDGILHTVLELPNRLQPFVISRLKLCAEMDIAERRRPQDGRLRVRFNEELIDMRVSTVPTPAGEKMVFRVLRGGSKSRTFDKLGFPKALQTQITQALGRSGKLWLVTGPTGSGKTTTLYTCLEVLKDGTVNIVTVEDPIEYRVSGINQIQVHENIGMTFAAALRSILRQDPDVIMIGEIRDAETAGIALQAAQTGHLVLSTMHANSAPEAINRLMNLGIDPYVITCGLGAVLAQRLVRLICKNCKKPASPEYMRIHQALMESAEISPESLKTGKGCDKCNFTGYAGQAGIFSYLEITPRLGELIHSKASMHEIVRAAREGNFVPLDQAALNLVEAGMTTFDEVIRYLDNGTASEAEAKAPATEGSAYDQPQASVENAPVTQQSNSKRPLAVIESPHSLAPPPYAQPVQLPPPVAYPPYTMVPMIYPQQALPQAYPVPGSAPAATNIPLGPGQTITRPKVLLVEDDVNLQKLISAVLKREMYEVTVAANGQEALQIVYQNPPSIIICDLKMPVVSGKEFMLRMKGNPQTRAIPILILTNSSDEENEIELLELGARDFVSKCGSQKVLLSRVRKILNNAG